MEQKVQKLTFVEYLRDVLLDTDYDSMASRADLEGESLAEILHENLNGKGYEVEMTDAEFKCLTKHLQAFVDEHYDDAVALVDEANENAREWEEARQEGLRGNY